MRPIVNYSISVYNVVIVTVKILEALLVSKVVSLRLTKDQIERLQRVGRQTGRSTSEAAVLLLEESLRQREFAFIQFRDSPAGRQAYLQGTRLAVWQIALLASHYDGDVSKAAAYLEIPAVQLTSALRYADSYPEEIKAAIADNEWAAAHLDSLVPGIKVLKIDASAP